MKKIITFLLVLISFLGYTQNNQDLFANANKLYKEGKYKQAIESYNKIIALGKSSSELYYNLGNSYYKLNKVAPTIYSYEKALKLNPNNTDAKNNLTLAKRLTLDRIEALPKTFLQRLSANYLTKLSYNSWGVLAIIFSFIAAMLFLLYYFARQSFNKRLFFITSIISFFIMLSAIFIALNQYSKYTSEKPAIVFSEKVTVKNEPTNSSGDSFTIHEGTKVLVLDGVDEWKKIKLADGKVGWLLSKTIKEL